MTQQSDDRAVVPVPAAAAPRSLREKLRVRIDLIKFEHSIFALPYAYIGALYGARVVTAPDPRFVTAGGWPTWSALGWVTVAMVGARAFAFAVNRAVDKEIDARNPRTAGRAMPAGLVKAGELWLFAAAVLAAFILAVVNLQFATRFFWPLVIIPFVVYPYLKRYTWLCHYWLGLCLGLAPVGGWVAVSGSVLDPAPWLFGGAVMLWTAGFDIIYATQDVECDLRDGLHSVPADLGIGPGLIQTRVLHAAAFLLLLAAGWSASAGWPFYVGLAIAGGLLAYENAIVKADDLSRVNAAFFTTNGMIAVVLFLGTVADRIIRT